MSEEVNIFVSTSLSLLYKVWSDKKTDQSKLDIIKTLSMGFESGQKWVKALLGKLLDAAY